MRSDFEVFDAHCDTLTVKGLFHTKTQLRLKDIKRYKKYVQVFAICADGNPAFLHAKRHIRKYNTLIKKWGMEQNYVLRCEVPLDADYPQARKIATEILKKLPDNHKLVLLADAFDYQVKSGYPKTENSVVYMPSKKYENPLLAFDVGVCCGKELADVSF